MVLTSNFLSSTPTVEIAAPTSSLIITELRLYTVRAEDTEDYSNFEFAFAEVLDVGNYRAEDFGTAYGNGQPYPFVAQLAIRPTPDEINPILVQRLSADELVFRNLSIKIDHGQTMSLLTVGVPLLPLDEAIGLVFSSGNTFADRYDTATNNGGLLLNIEAGLPESEYALTVIATTSIPEPNSVLFMFGVLVVTLLPRRNRIVYSQR